MALRNGYLSRPNISDEASPHLGLQFPRFCLKGCVEKIPTKNVTITAINQWHTQTMNFHINKRKRTFTREACFQILPACPVTVVGMESVTYDGGKLAFEMFEVGYT